MLCSSPKQERHRATPAWLLARLRVALLKVWFAAVVSFFVVLFGFFLNTPQLRSREAGSWDRSPVRDGAWSCLGQL